MNNFSITGNLVREPELRQTKTGKSVTTVTVAVKRPFVKDETDFFDVVAWGDMAEFVCEYFTKGKRIEAAGYMVTREWENDEGETVRKFEMQAQYVGFCGENKAEGEKTPPKSKLKCSPKQKSVPKSKPKKPAFNPEDYEDIDEDEDLPF